MIREHITTVLSLTITAAVVLASLHLTQVVGASLLPDDKRVVDVDTVKIKHDPHTHTDKVGSQLIKDAGDTQKSTDGRSLRLLREHKKNSPNRLRTTANWLTALWEVGVLTLV